MILGILPPEGLSALGGECAFLGGFPFFLRIDGYRYSCKKTAVKIAFLYYLYGDEDNIKVQFQMVILIAFLSKNANLILHFFNKIYRR